MHRLRPHPATALAAVLAVGWLLADPPTADLAAQAYRTDLFERAGFVVWNNGWYGGHHVPSYSLLFPPLAALLGPRAVGALAAIAATWCFERLLMRLRGPGDRAARIAALWFATAAVACLLVTGRLTFALGFAVAVGAALALADGRTGLCAALGAVSGLASPVAAAFLALTVAAWAIAQRRVAAGAALIAAALLPVILLAAAFPAGGDFPFVPSSLWPTLGATLLLLAVLPARERTLRWGVGLYALAVLAAGLLPTPMGGNAARLGPLLAGPVAALALLPARRRLLLALAPALLYWQLHTPVDDWLQAAADPSTRPGYSASLKRFLNERMRTEGPFRVEIPFTDNHWEAAHVAGGEDGIPLARGWERQLDRKVNALFYDRRPLTAERYRRWLRDKAVRYVALPDAPIDYSAAREAELVRRGLPYLRPVWRDRHWRVYAVRGAAPLADGARVTELAPDRVRLAAERPGRVLLRVRFTPYWRLARGSGCVRRAGDHTELDLRRAGEVVLEARFAPSRVAGGGPYCRG